MLGDKYRVTRKNTKKESGICRVLAGGDRDETKLRMKRFSVCRAPLRLKVSIRKSSAAFLIRDTCVRSERGEETNGRVIKGERRLCTLRTP